MVQGRRYEAESKRLINETNNWGLGYKKLKTKN